MAVYKATYCFPFLNSFDGRVTPTTGVDTPAQYLKCKIDTSNKDITGYSIEIYDDNNNLIFPKTKKISPVLELPQNLGDSINSGINGTYLHIPFFQNYWSPVSFPEFRETTEIQRSYNAVYYRSFIKVHYVLGILEEFQGLNNSNNWSLDSTTEELHYEGSDGIFNEEFALKDELVLVISSNNTKGGIYSIQSSGFLKKYSLPGTTDSLNITYFKSNKDKYITVTNGLFHDRIYKYADNESLGYFEEVSEDTSMWVDYNDKAINFTNNGGNYKWVITLYQSPNLGKWENNELIPDYRLESKGILVNADGSNVSDNISSSYEKHPWSCNYNNMSTNWCDMILNRGTILGSTKDRIQISDADGKLLPGDNSTDVVVLQSRWVQLLKGSGVQFQANLGTRARITSYDSSYGHIYPKTGSFTSNLIDDAEYVEVYKYSNDPDTITATDSVQLATTGNIANLSGSIVIDGVNVEQGWLVLVKDQTNAYENGVYSVNTDADWTRSGSYDEWGNFIGAVIFVKNGSKNRYKNFISQARAGGKLHIPGTTVSMGDSPLIFTEEKPLLLFPSLINQTVTFYSNADVTGNTTVLDSIAVKDGDTVLCPSNNTGVVKQYSASSSTWTKISDAQYEGIYKILYGKKYGGTYYKVVSYYGTCQEAFTPVRAKILKNTVNSTYIKPYIGLLDGMLLHFVNNQKITYSDGSKKDYLLAQAVNNKFWKITHATLKSPLPSYSEDGSNTGVPYSYEIRSYFKTSDENPFYLYDEPYLKLGDGNGGFSTIDSYTPFTVVNGTESSVEDQLFQVKKETSSTEYVLFYVKQPSVSGLATRYVSLQGHYYQWQQASWESYRWILTDYKGEVLQDTGKKYDRNMMATFYGLSNEQAHFNNQYYAILLVEDSLGFSLSFSIYITVDPNSTTTLKIPFYAKYDCDTHSVVLSYQTRLFIKPSIILDQSSKIAYAYTADDLLLSRVWDNSVKYTNSPSWGKINNLDEVDEGWLEVTGTDNDVTEPEIYDILRDKTFFSYSELNGVKYEYGFEKDSMTQNTDNNRLCVIDTDDDSQGSFSLQTKVKLPDNFCSSILETAVDYANNVYQLHIQLSVPLKFKDYESDELDENRNKILCKMWTNSPNSKVFSTYLCTTNDSCYQWRKSATKTLFFLQNSLKKAANWPDKTTEKVIADKNNEYVHYQTFTDESNSSIKYFPYYICKRNASNKDIAINSTKFLGNACLVSKNDFTLVTNYDTAKVNYSSAPYTTTTNTKQLDWSNSNNDCIKFAPVYWTERLPFIIYQKDDCVVYPMNFSKCDVSLTKYSYNTPNDVKVFWPKEEEKKYYWEEYGDENNTDVLNWRKAAPTKWSQIKDNRIGDGNESAWKPTDDQLEIVGWRKLDYFERNPYNLSDYSFLITIRIYNIEQLSSYITNFPNNMKVSGKEEDNNVYTTVLKLNDNDTLLGKISICKIKDSDGTSQESGT